MNDTQNLGIDVGSSKKPEYPLSYYQLRLWYLDQLDPNTPAYNISHAFRLIGLLDVAALNESINSITQRHQSLRTTFENRESGPVQVISDFKRLDITRISLALLPQNECEIEAKNIFVREIEKGFDLNHGPLSRWLLIELNEQESLLILTIHRLISDAWSLNIIFGELAKTYSGLVSGHPASQEPLETGLVEYCQAENDWIDSEECHAQVSYWKQVFSNIPEPVELPTDFSRPAFQRYHSSSQTIKLEAELCSELRALGDRNNATVFMVLLAGFKSLLFRYTNQEDICVGVFLDKRNQDNFRDVVGCFTNAVAIRTQLDDDPEFERLLVRVRENVLGAYANSDVPFEKLLDEIKPERSLSRPPIFQVMMGLQSAPVRDLNLAGLKCLPVDLKMSRSNFDIQMWVRESGDELEIVMDYSTDLFEDSTISRMMEHFRILLKNVVKAPGDRISEIEIISENEKTILLDEWSGRNRVTDIPDSTVIHTFENNALTIPEGLALVDLHCVDGASLDMTYRELNAEANKLAWFLKELDIGPETKVALLLEPYRFLIIAMFGVLKAGGAYVPLDAKWPESRISYILNDTRAPVIITDEANLIRLESIISESNLVQSPEIICVDRNWNSISGFSSANIPEKPAMNQSAYLIYTSGSTGNPKGVIIEHEALALFTSSAIKLYGINKNDRVLQFSSPSFDSSVEEIFCSLCSGATLVLRSNATLSSMTSFLAECANAGITLLDLPTAFWQQIATYVEEESMLLPESLRMVIIGGEQPAADKFRCWQNNASPLIRLMNTYGPTETTVIVTAIDLSQWSPLERTNYQIPMGEPLEHVRAYILDKNFKPTPIGVPGELCIGGKSLARGYLNLPQKTSERFIRDPYGDDEPDRIYRTGDRVRYLKDGYMEFFGRVDRQVKVRGFRVELDEIDNALRSLLSVSEAYTIAKREGSAPAQLVAFVVAPADLTVEPSELREELKSRIPDFMIPSSFVILKKFPLTSGGKIDVAALRAHELSPGSHSDSYVAPRTPVEEVLANIWQDIFKLDRIGVNDNFFDLGGHSLLSLQIIDRVNKAGLVLTPAQFIQNPTIAAQARFISSAKPDSEAGMWQCLVQLQPNGSRPPLYLIHSNPGDVLGYVNLVNRLGQNQPCYGFESLGLRDLSLAHKSVEEMATFYIDEMLAFQPTPPYHLAGWCYGGIVAIEMAYQLQQRNLEVGLLGLIETPFPVMASNRKWYLFNKLLGLMKLGPVGWLSYVRNKMKYMKRLESGRIDSIFALELDGGVFTNRPQVYKINSMAMDQYKLRQFPNCPVELFVGDTIEEGFIPDIESLWSRISDKIERHNVAGSHLSILKEPGVSVVARILKESLE